MRSREKKIEISTERKGTFIFAILLIILTFSIYVNSLDVGFIWDDIVLVKDNIYIKKWTYFDKIFFSDIAAGAGKEYQFYRPLQILTYTIDYSLWKLNVAGYHFTNILLHTSVALLTFSLINILYKDTILSFFTSSLFAVWPVHTWVVTYISGRADSLAAVLILLCIIFYIKSFNAIRKSYYILIPVCYLFALLSKETSLILPLLLLLFNHIFKVKLEIRRFFPILAISFIYIVVRLTFFRLSFSEIMVTSNLFQRLIGFCAALPGYLSLLLLPLNLHMEYGYKIFNPADLKVILGYAMLVFLLIFWFKKRKGNSPVFFSISWFFITLLPQSNIYPINAYMAEHWLYLPSLGFFLIVAYNLRQLYKSKNSKGIAIICIGSLIFFYSFLTVIQNKYWKDPITFYERNLKFSPKSPRLLNNLALSYKSIGNYKKAMELYKEAIEYNPDHIEAYNNLGVLYITLDKLQDGILLFKKAIEINPNYAKAYNNLGQAYTAIGQLDLAIAEFKKAIELNPDYIKAHENLGKVYNKMGLKIKN